MRKLVFAFWMLGCCMLLQAQNEVLFEFSDGIPDGALKTKIEQQVMGLLTAINIA